MKEHNADPMLDQAVCDYLLWMIETGYSQTTWSYYERILIRFQKYISSRHICWELIFTVATLDGFHKHCQVKKCRQPIRSLARYLYNNHRISNSFNQQNHLLSGYYKQYLGYYKKTRQVGKAQIVHTRGILVLFADWLVKGQYELADIRIQQLDFFQAEIGARYAPSTRPRIRSVLRGFTNWLYHQKIIERDLAPFLVGTPQYGQARPPRFLRPDELQKLFSIHPENVDEIRTWAMLHLACFLGLRPIEISLISLDDIQFSKQQITLPRRKGANPISVPLPIAVIKAVADYIIGARPETTSRAVFLRFRAPYYQINGAIVSQSITAWMRKAGVPGSSYWLRHTYAQNLLEAGATIFAIKEMLGHDGIQTTSHYLRIHTKMMREVLFNETI